MAAILPVVATLNLTGRPRGALQGSDSRGRGSGRNCGHRPHRDPTMFTLYDYLPSRNAWKVRQLLQHLGQPWQTRIVSIFEGEGRRPDYLAISPTGTVPAIELDDGRTIAESNAILMYLAEGSQYLA